MHTQKGVYQIIKLILQKRMLVILILGFSSGLPLSLITTTLQAWLTVSNVDLTAIGVFSFVGMPYLYKFIWAPFFDKFFPPILSRRRGWIFITQLLLVASLILMAFAHPEKNPAYIAIIAIIIAFFSATQDIVIDAYRAEILTTKERGLGVAVTIAGYRIALIVSGGLALIMAHYIGFAKTYFLMALVIFLCSFITIYAPLTEKIIPPQSLRKAIMEPIQNFLQRPAIIALIIFIIIYKLGDAFALSLSSVFLLRGIGFDLVTVGIANKVVGLSATIIGVLFGGIFLARLKLFKSLLWFGILQGFSNLLFMWLALAGKNYYILLISIIGENFCGGMGTAAFLALIMALCDKRYTATQFALLTALSAIMRVIIGPIAAIIVKHIGWAEFYWWSFVFSIPAILLLLYLHKKINFDRDYIV